MNALQAVATFSLLLALCACDAEAAGARADAVTVVGVKFPDADPELSPLQDPFLRYAERRVLKALARKNTWDGPRTGPKARPRQTVVFVAADMRNGGVQGVYDGVREAAKALDWQIQLVDGAGSPATRTAGVRRAIASRPSGIIFGGFDAREQSEGVAAAAKSGIPVVGWHAAAIAGAVDGLFTNVTTDPLDVAEVTALFTVLDSGGRARVVILTDSSYSIATAKADRMLATLRRCRHCNVLAVEDASLASVPAQAASVTAALWQRFGANWKYSLAINDLYYDHMAAALRALGVEPRQIVNISAGDGSRSAYERVRSESFQAATVPEPLNLHGWQLLDELNRALSHAPPSGYSTPVHLVTLATLPFDGGSNDRFDPENGYRDAYRAIWGR